MKAIPYIIAVGIMLLGGGLYLQANSDENAPLIDVTIGSKPEERVTDTPTLNEKQLFINHGKAPELTGTTGWLNSGPMNLEQLKGSVVLVEFWTYSSINSIQALPQLSKWYDQYKDQGFRVIGVHTPEFAFEKVTANVAAAAVRYKITHPIVLDNNYKTWAVYNNQFWPATYLIDKNGDIVYTHYGEGDYENTEKAIRTLLGMEGPFDIPPAPVVNKSQTPEIYLGLTRLSAFGGSEKTSDNEQLYVFPPKLAKNKFALEGYWEYTQETVKHTKGFGRIRMNFDAGKVFMVAQSPKPAAIKIYVDGKLIRGVVVKESDLYELYNTNESGPHTLEIEVQEQGFELFTLTFG